MSTDEHIATGCEWTPDVDGNWNTGCGQTFVIIDGTPIENDMKFCCYCGLCLDQLPYIDGDSDPDLETDEETYDSTGHYPGCGVGEGTQKGPCSCKDRATADVSGSNSTNEATK